MEDWKKESERQAALIAQAKEDLEKFQASLLLAGFKTKRYHELINGYYSWYRNDAACPWYLFETDVGLIKIGWRKRVINVDWSSTEVKWNRPIDQDISYGETYFHAWGYDKLLEYLKLLYPVLKK